MKQKSLYVSWKSDEHMPHGVEETASPRPTTSNPPCSAAWIDFKTFHGSKGPCQELHLLLIAAVQLAEVSSQPRWAEKKGLRWITNKDPIASAYLGR